ncbi:MAG: CHASE2 domain-containing protein [Methylococcales bacterium]
MLKPALNFLFIKWCAKPEWTNHLAGHFLAALFFASLGVLLHNSLLLSSLDTLFLRFAAARVPSIDSGPQQISPPVVLGIDDVYYEKKFHQASPLNRGELKRMISKIVESRPRVLAIDLDLSPGPTVLPGESELYKHLYGIRLSGLPIVLQLPLPVYDTELRNRKVEWMNSLCKKGIEFGQVSIDSQFGMVTKIRRGPDRLSCSVYRLKHVKFPDRDILKICHGLELPPEHGTVAPYSVPICELFKLQPEEQGKARFMEAKELLHPFYLQTIRTGKSDDSEYAPINFKFVRHVKSIRIKRSYDIPTDLEEKVVFLGGFYGDSDRFNTPVGEISGVMLLAGDYFSLLSSIDEPHKIVGVMLEIAFGIVLGFAFALGWKWYFGMYAVFRRGHEDNVIVSTVGYLGAILISSPMLLVILGIFALLSAELLSRGWWVNPVPMVLGMAGKAFVTSLEALESRHESHSGKQPNLWASRVLVAIVMTAYIAVIVCPLKILLDH